VTLHDLQVEPLDVAADALGLLLGAPAPPPLAELRLSDGDGGELLLGVLAASHVVTATRPGQQVREQVSCDALAAGGQRLPARWEDDGYRLTSTTRSLPADALAALATRLREHAGGPDWVCGTFPGAAGALTALTGGPLPDGWAWRTWHLYPGARAGVVVATTSSWQP